MAITSTPRNAFTPLLLALIPIIGLALYILSGALAGEFINEANQITILNAQVTEPGGLRDVWTLPTPSHASSRFAYRPVLAQLLRLEYGAFASPSSYHAVSLFLYLGVLVAFVLLLGRLLDHPGGRVAATLTLALHPMFTQAVANVAAQGVLLSLLATLAACYGFMLYRQGRIGLRRCAMLVFLFSFIAIGSCEMGLLLPLWLAALGLLTPRTVPAPTELPARKRARRAGAGEESASAIQAPASGLKVALALGLPLLVLIALYLEMRRRALGSLAPAPLEGLGGLRDVPRMIGAYLGRLLWPAKPTYFYSIAESWHLTPIAPVAWALLAGLAAAAAWAWRRWPLLALGVIFLLTSLAALSHVAPLTFFMSEQPLPFALTGLALIAGAAVSRLTSPLWSFPPERRRDLALVGLLCLAWLAMGWQTWARTREWRKTETLWQAEAALHPNSAAPLMELLEDHVRAGRFESARSTARAARRKARPLELARILELEAAAAVAQNDDVRLKQLIDEALAEKRPTRTEHLDRIAIFARDRDFKQEYAQLLQKQTEFYPKSFEAYYGLSKIEMDAENYGKAIEWGSKAIQYAQGRQMQAIAFERYGVILYKARRIPEAEMELRQALMLDKTLYEAYIHLALIQWGRKEYERAKETVQACYENARNKVTSLRDIVEVYSGILESQNRHAEAVTWMEGQMNQYPSDVPLQIFGARYMIQFGRYERAERAYTALWDMPEAGRYRVDILVGMGLIKQRGYKDNAEAARFWRKALEVNPLNAEAKKFLAAIEESK